MPESEPNEYSREVFNKAETDIKEAKGRIDPNAPVEELRAAVDDRASAEARKGHLHEMAWGEALELNKQYDELYARKEQVEKEIADFRKEKLGMAEEERVAEAEQKEPTLEQWAWAYAEMEGIKEDMAKILEAFQTLQAEMSEEERKVLTMPVYVKEKTTAATAWAMVKKENPTYEFIELEKIKTPDETSKALVAFGRFSQEADKDSLGENAQSGKDWKETSQKFMSLKVAMVAREAFRRLTGKQMDERSWTMCPGSRSENDNVTRLGFSPNKVTLDDVLPGSRYPFNGVRRVVSRELESNF